MRPTTPFRAIAVAVPLALALDGPIGTARAASPTVGDDTLVAWRIAGRAPNAKARRDVKEKHGGEASGLLSASAPTTDMVNSAERGRGGPARGPRVRPVFFEQTLNAVPYRERRVRVSMWVRTKLPDKPAKDVPVSQAHAFVRIENEDGTITSYDGSSISPIFGTTDWTRKVVVIEVPPDAFALSFGVGLLGPGDVWVDDATIEDQAPAAGAYAKQPMMPPERLQQLTPEQLAQGKEMLARRATMMKERPAEIVNGDFEMR